MEGNVEENDFAFRIGQADRRFKSWRKKLAWIADVLAEEGPRVGMDKLVYLAIYFRFMGNGEIPFAEDGGHYRPSHHAKTARRIHGLLSAIRTSENGFVIRKIVPWLPSYKDAFTRAEPLTRIRDIAHRNDIPRDLKHEIKTTLQNKLHRSAGPEDLLTSERLLQRITEPDADYSPDFVEAFRRFHEELKEFFNARSLDEQLEGVPAQGDPSLAHLIREFRSARAGATGPEQRLAVLEILTGLRSRILQEIDGKEGARVQELERVDIKLEDYCFVLLSRLSNDFEAWRNGIPWGWALFSLELAIRNLQLSGLEEEECGALETELDILREGLDPSDREKLLQLKAAVDRAGGLAETYCRRILEWFPARAERLGRLLGVPDHAVRVFAEADIRSHPVFQLSRLVAFLRKRIGTAASLPAWDVIVPGAARGRLVPMAHLDGAEDTGEGGVVALLEKVEGDEEIPPAVSAILVAEQTPHLSHIAVRARQEGVLFAVCEEKDLLEELRKLSNRKVAVKASLGGVGVEPFSDIQTTGKKERTRAREAGRVKPPEVQLASDPTLVPLETITPRTGGGKAYGARRLAELAAEGGEMFRTPPGAVIPFGVMEASFQGHPSLAEEYRRLMQNLNQASGEGFANDLNRLRGIVEQLRVPETVVSGVRERFLPGDRLMIRSSSSVEDLEATAGAGLYESVSNAGFENVEDAVRKVWASLWTRRAAVNRKNLGISHDETHMAVLIQRMQVPEDLSFIMHTVHPVSRNGDELCVELAVGLGETLASGKDPGVPFRVSYDKRTGESRMDAFSTLRRALWPVENGGLAARRVDYSAVEFSRSREYRVRLSARLGEIGRLVEKFFGGPQDIEGLVSGEGVWLVQSRPQQMEV